MGACTSTHTKPKQITAINHRCIEFKSPTSNALYQRRKHSQPPLHLKRNSIFPEECPTETGSPSQTLSQ